MAKSKRQKQKKPKAAFNPSSAKIPRTAAFLHVLNNPPSWHFAYVDTGGPWCWTRMSREQASTVLQRLQALESMLWAEIEGSEHHSVPIDRICPKAQKRLQEIGRDELDVVFSLRIGAKPRVIGIRAGAAFYFLWWDPLHQVCPSTKRNT